jgi:hypothetical protein
LVASLSSMIELIEDCIDAAATNGVHWGTRSTLATAMLHFPELGVKLELLGSGRNTYLMKDLVDALWTEARLASDSLASFIPLSVARGSPHGLGEM